jgi:hypothetical protein
LVFHPRPIFFGVLSCPTKNLTRKKFSLIPPDIQQLWGPSPVLASENREAYQQLALQIAGSVKPNDVLDWLMVKDVVDLSWEIRRLRRFKAKYIEIYPDQLSAEKISRYRAWAGRDIKLGGILEHTVADEFVGLLPEYALMDSLLASAESRRAATLREIERWRDSFGSRLRKASDEVIDGEIIDDFADPVAPAGSRQTSVGKIIPKNAPKARRDRTVAALPPPQAKKKPAPALRKTSP